MLATPQVSNRLEEPVVCMHALPKCLHQDFEDHHARHPQGGANILKPISASYCGYFSPMLPVCLTARELEGRGVSV